VGIEHLSDLNVVLIASTFFFAGVVKGILGFGTPLIVIPVVTALFDVVTALVMVAIPTLIPNLWQMWQFRNARDRHEQLLFLIVGMIPGIAIGASILAQHHASVILSQSLGLMICVFLLTRFFSIDKMVSSHGAKLLSFPVGVATGFLAGTVGITSPVTLTYLAAQKLSRRLFIYQVSAVFAAMGGLQAVFFYRQNLADLDILFLSVLGLFPLFFGMLIGQIVGAQISQSSFEKLVYAALGFIGVKLIIGI
jgi:uncharacterized membrane protein YfcA